MSEAALVETIRLDIRVHAREDVSLAVAPGLWRTIFKKKKPGFRWKILSSAVILSGPALNAFTGRNSPGAFGRACWKTGQSGRWCDEYIPGMVTDGWRFCLHARGPLISEADALLPMNTTEEAADFLYEHGYLKQVMEQVANQVKAVLEEESGVQTEVMLFSSNYGLMARTAGADAYVRELLEMERGMEVMIDRRIINYEKLRFEY